MNLLVYIGLILPAISLVILLLVLKYQYGTLWTGAGAALFLGSLVFSTLIWILQFFHWQSSHPDQPIAAIAATVLIIICILAAFALLFFPTLFILFLVVEGIRLIRKEGIRASNLLSLGAGLLVILFLVFLPYSVEWGAQSYFHLFVLVFASMFIGYFALLVIIYFFSALICQFHLPVKNRLDYIIVLGCGIFGTEVTPLLASRIMKAVRLQKKNPGAKLIFSGGQGPGEDIPEAEAMAAYARKQGVAEETVLVENKSVNTRENLAFSQEVLNRDRQNSLEKKHLIPKVGVVTSNYHVFRALVFARMQDFPALGYGAPTKLYFALNAFLREFVGYLSLTWKKQLLKASVIAFLVSLPVLIMGM